MLMDLKTHTMQTFELWTTFSDLMWYRLWRQKTVSNNKKLTLQPVYLNTGFNQSMKEATLLRLKKRYYYKVRIFWEGHKIWKNLPLKIWCYSVMSNFCGRFFSNFLAFSEYPNFTTNCCQLDLKTWNLDKVSTAIRFSKIGNRDFKNYLS